MVNRRIIPLNQHRRQALRRQRQSTRFRRIQAIGLLVFAALFLLFRLAHTPAGWLFPHGWWRW